MSATTESCRSDLQQSIHALALPSWKNILPSYTVWSLVVIVFLYNAQWHTICRIEILTWDRASRFSVVLLIYYCEWPCMRQWHICARNLSLPKGAGLGTNTDVIVKAGSQYTHTLVTKSRVSFRGWGTHPLDWSCCGIVLKNTTNDHTV